MRLVLSTYPSREAALGAVEGALARDSIACASLLPTDSRYWWKGKVESASEVLVLFKTVPKLVGGLFRYVRETHPYRVPEVVEIDVPRAEPAYLAYLEATLDPSSSAPPRGSHAKRRAGPRAPGSSTPSTNSREAPPPVEKNWNAFSTPSMTATRAVSPPAATW